MSESEPQVKPLHEVLTQKVTSEAHLAGDHSACPTEAECYASWLTGWEGGPDQSGFLPSGHEIGRHGSCPTMLRCRRRSDAEVMRLTIEATEGNPGQRIMCHHFTMSDLADHSLCDNGSLCWQFWLPTTGLIAPMSHYKHRHHGCPENWSCRRNTEVDQEHHAMGRMEPEEHQFTGTVEHDLLLGSGHPQVIETMPGDIVFLPAFPAPQGTDPYEPNLAESLGVMRVQAIPGLTTPFVFRRAQS
jgi:hypothetical protein